MEANLILDDSDPTRPLVREPDVYVLREENDPEDDGLFQRAENALLVVEVMSPGSGIIDWVRKMSEYADAGIPHYWIVDLDDPISLVACHLDGELGYIDGGAVTGVFDTTEPFPVRLDLGALG